MKNIPFLFLLFAVILSCTKPGAPTQPTPVSPIDSTDTTTNPVDTTDTIDTTVVIIDTFTTYTIPAGAQYVVGNSYAPFFQSSLRFKAILDSSCIYETVNPVNQADINKLYGFADCNTFHHDNSARFGWNWHNGAMRIHAYCYADSVRSYTELGTVNIGEPFTCNLRVLPGMYIFTLNSHTDTLLRHCTDTAAKGYKLLPFFGGDETAPHEIRIRIQEF